MLARHDMPPDLAGRWRSAVVLKRDVFSTVERGTFVTADGEVGAVLRRLDEVPWWSRPLARVLFRHEVGALAVAGTLGFAPPLLYADKAFLVRGYIPGVAVKIARPYGDRAFFRSAKAALLALHRAGISHNDLAKEQNWLRGTDGRAYLIDFQLATTFRRRGRIFRIARYEDLRHLLKHKRRYLPDDLTAKERQVVARKSVPTRIWMATGKRVYYLVTRGLFNFIDAEGGGKRVAQDAPRIEAALKAHPAVRDAAVLDFPDRKAGIGLYAFVEAPASLAEADLRQRAVAAVGADKAPEHIQIVDTLPRTDAGAVRTDVLRFISTNQVDLVPALIASETERAAVDRIVRERKNQYGTREVADALKRHPAVRDVVVVAFPDRLRGTGLYAFVEGPESLGEDALHEHAAAAVGKREAPQHIQRVEALPRRADGSVHTEILQLVATNQVDRIDALAESDEARRAADAIAAGRKNFRDRFTL